MRTSSSSFNRSKHRARHRLRPEIFRSPVLRRIGVGAHRSQRAQKSLVRGCTLSVASVSARVEWNARRVSCPVSSSVRSHLDGGGE